MKKPVVTIQKLGRQQAWGVCWSDGRIEIDPRQSSKDFLDTLIHEMLHHFWPDLEEEEVSKAARIMASVAWKLRYRRMAE
jgi:hypothetical protein